MNVNSVMNTYNMNSLWNSINPQSSSSSSSVPLVSNVDSAVNESYAVSNFSGGTTSTQLQDIFQQVEPDYDISLTYDQHGNLSTPSSTASTATSGESSTSTGASMIVSMLNNGNTTEENSIENIISQYGAVQNSLYNQSLSSVLSGDQKSGSNLDTLM